METSEFNQELREFVGSFCVVEQCQCGKWEAYLDPTHEFVRNGLQPPGQCNFYEYGNPTYTATNQMFEGYKAHDLDLNDLAVREEYKKQWAARPYFYSADAARRMIEHWVFANRKDIVSEAISNAMQALAYRRHKAA